MPDSVLIDQLIREIAADQIKTKQGDFVNGMFYSYRQYAGYGQRTTPDENVFFTAILSFALKNLMPYLNSNNQKIADTIIQKAVATYPYFINPHQLPIYYFWHNGYPVMPHSYWISRSGKKIAVSEDQDDTVMIMMTSNPADSTLKRVKELMDASANGKRRFTKTTYKKYKYLPAHTTYFGKNMLADFDFAVHCNIVYFLMEKKMQLTGTDSATIFLLQQLIKERKYLTDPTYISPYYVHAPILMYHIARLLGKFKIAALEPYRQQLITDIKSELKKSRNIMNDVILSTSLLRLTGSAPPLPIKNLEDFKRSNQHDFVFYQARAAILFPNPFKRIFLHFSMLNYYYFCPDYNKALLLEYLVEKNKNNEAFTKTNL